MGSSKHIPHPTATDFKHCCGCEAVSVPVYCGAWERWVGIGQLKYHKAHSLC